MSEETTPPTIPAVEVAAEPRDAAAHTQTPTRSGADAADASDTPLSPLFSVSEPDTEPDTEKETQDAAPRGPQTFAAMNLQPEVQRAIDEMGYESPMDVQSAVYEPMTAGRDVMVQARTGTGKTAAFAIPVVQAISPDATGVQAIALCPTRELAMQVGREFDALAKFKGLKVVSIYGGAPIGPQIDALKGGAQIIAGTPGRVLDHIGRRTFDTSNIKHLILDECDEMLSMGFQEEIERIISTLPPREERQTLLFSATIPSEIQRIARRHQVEPQEISLSDGGISVDAIDHHYYIVSGMAKTKDLLKVLLREKPERAIIFCNTRENTTTVASYLQRQGYDALAISSDLSQRERERVMSRMREGNVRYMVATDVAARGIDISKLSHVFNYGFPESPEVYVHRTGRTGRAGQRGVAISLVGPRELGSFYYLKLTYKIVPQECDLPTAEEFAAMQETERFNQIVSWVDEGASEEFKALARKLWDSEDGERVLAALIKRLFNEKAAASKQETRQDRKQAERDSEWNEERPRRSRRGRSDRSSRSERSRTARPRRDAKDESKPASDEPGEQQATETTATVTPETSTRTARDSSATGTAGATGDTGENGERKRRRRRRRRRPEGREASADASASAGSGGSKEFWETWADEKSSRDDSATPSAAADAGDAAEPTLKAKASAPEANGTARLYLNLGKREDITTEEIRDMVSGALGDDAEKIGSIALRNTHCYVRVPDECADAVIEELTGTTYKEREVVAERAKR